MEMLVDSTKLDACLDAEADAIRAKTGGSADIPFDFVNNKGFADAIAAVPVPALESKSISANGTYTPESGKAWNEVVVNVSASPRTANGTFTIASSVDYMPIVQHNLGTDKIAFVIYPDSIVATVGYTTYFLSYFPWNYYMGNDVWQLDFSSYNSNFTGPINVDSTERSIHMRSGDVHTSPWASQNTWYSATSYISALNDDDVIITNSTLRTTTTIASLRLAKGTYKWVAVALE